MHANYALQYSSCLFNFTTIVIFRKSLVVRLFVHFCRENQDRVFYLHLSSLIYMHRMAECIQVPQNFTANSINFVRMEHCGERQRETQGRARKGEKCQCWLSPHSAALWLYSILSHFFFLTMFQFPPTVQTHGGYCRVLETFNCPSV